ncbi:MAG TPA: ABC transporter permease [Gemmatimonadales bacterium]|nr:ABC transporter permease [Gemmatimonadales bacterium]
MSFFDALRHRLRPLLRRGDFDRELEEELRHHQQLSMQEFPGAQSQFGSHAYYKEETRGKTLLGWIDPLSQDLKYALRNLWRTPGFTIVAVLSLAIGIGANSAIFSLIYSILLRPLPVSHPERLALVQHTGPDLPNDGFSYNEYRALRQSPGFTSVTAWGGADHVPIVAGAIHSTVTVDAVDGNFFSTLGLEAQQGRLITPEDESTRAPVLVISDGLWTEWFNRAPNAVGSTVTMRGAAFTVIGVAPKTFTGLEDGGQFNGAIPLGTLGSVGATPVEDGGADSAVMEIVGRLPNPAALPGVTKMLDATYRSCCAKGGDQAGGVQLTTITHGIPLWKFDVHAMFGRLLAELLGAAGVVLLAACANLGTLLLARASARERELAVRLSLGAPRRRLAGQMLVESTLLAGLGAGAGLLLANWALRLIAHRLPDPIVNRAGLALTGEVLGFTAAVAVAAVVLFGAVPAWRASQTSLIGPLKDGGRSFTGRRAGWIDRSVVVAQVALALVLVNGAGMLVATLRSLRNVDAGFSTDHQLSVELDSRGTPYESRGLAQFVDGLMTRAARIPGVRSAALSEAAPIFGGRFLSPTIAVQGYTPKPDESMRCWFDPVTPGFFTTMGIGMRGGRDFTDADRGAGGVAIVNDAFVHQYLRDRNPLGATIRTVQGADTLLMQIVGVAGDARYADLRAPATPLAYIPLAQFERIPVLGRLIVLTLSVRTVGDDRAVATSLRNAVFTEAPATQAYGPETIEASVDASLNRETLTAEIATLFGVVALVLAAIGLYGVVSYRVTQRTREIGVRVALGAAAPDVVWLVFRQALALVAIGVLVGAPLTLASGKAIAAELYGLGHNPFYVLGAGVLLVGVAMAASVLPARRAAAVDPLIALRAD